jgi:hypothetical protein
MEKAHFRNEGELGYPHELILYALARSETVISRSYRSRVKLLANLLRSLVGEKSLKVDVPKGADVEIRVLESLTKTSPFRSAFEGYRDRFHQLIEQYSAGQSSPSLDALLEFVEDGVYLHILSKEVGKGELLSAEDMKKIIEILNKAEGRLAGIFSAIQLWESSFCDSVPNEVINALASPEKERLSEAAIFLSYTLATRCSRSKRELLVAHYQLVRKAVEDLSDTLNQENLSDEVFERLFRVAIVLFLCGYLKSIRLPQEEKVRYVDEIIKSPSVEQVFGEIFDSVAHVPIPKVESNVPLWILALADLILIILHWTVEIQRPFETSLFGISITIPAVPVFLLFAIIVLLILFWRLLYLKRNLIKSLRRGTLD